MLHQVIFQCRHVAGPLIYMEGSLAQDHLPRRDFRERNTLSCTIGHSQGIVHSLAESKNRKLLLVWAIFQDSLDTLRVIGSDILKMDLTMLKTRLNVRTLALEDLGSGLPISFPAHSRYVGESTIRALDREVEDGPLAFTLRSNVVFDLQSIMTLSFPATVVGALEPTSTDLSKQFCYVDCGPHDRSMARSLLQQGGVMVECVIATSPLPTPEVAVPEGGEGSGQPPGGGAELPDVAPIRNIIRSLMTTEGDVDSDDPICASGMTSQQAQLGIKMLSRHMGRKLPATLVFDHPTLRELEAALLMDQHSTMAGSLGSSTMASQHEAVMAGHHETDTLHHLAQTIRQVQKSAYIRHSQVTTPPSQMFEADKYARRLPAFHHYSRRRILRRSKQPMATCAQGAQVPTVSCAQEAMVSCALETPQTSVVPYATASAPLHAARRVSHFRQPCRTLRQRLRTSTPKASICSVRCRTSTPKALVNQLTAFQTYTPPCKPTVTRRFMPKSVHKYLEGTLQTIGAVSEELVAADSSLMCCGLLPPSITPKQRMYGSRPSPEHPRDANFSRIVYNKHSLRPVPALQPETARPVISTAHVKRFDQLFRTQPQRVSYTKATQAVATAKTDFTQDSRTSARTKATQAANVSRVIDTSTAQVLTPQPLIQPPVQRGWIESGRMMATSILADDTPVFDHVPSVKPVHDVIYTPGMKSASRKVTAGDSLRAIVSRRPLATRIHRPLPRSTSMATSSTPVHQLKTQSINQSVKTLITSSPMRSRIGHLLPPNRRVMQSLRANFLPRNTSRLGRTPTNTASLGTVKPACLLRCARLTRLPPVSTRTHRSKRQLCNSPPTSAPVGHLSSSRHILERLRSRHGNIAQLKTAPRAKLVKTISSAHRIASLHTIQTREDIAKLFQEGNLINSDTSLLHHGIQARDKKQLSWEGDRRMVTKQRCVSDPKIQKSCPVRHCPVASVPRVDRIVAPRRQVASSPLRPVIANPAIRTMSSVNAKDARLGPRPSPPGTMQSAARVCCIPAPLTEPLQRPAKVDKAVAAMVTHCVEDDTRLDSHTLVTGCAHREPPASHIEFKPLHEKVVKSSLLQPGALQGFATLQNRCMHSHTFRSLLQPTRTRTRSSPRILCKNMETDFKSSVRSSRMRCQLTPNASLRKCRNRLDTISRAIVKKDYSQTRQLAIIHATTHQDSEIWKRTTEFRSRGLWHVLQENQMLSNDAALTTYGVNCNRKLEQLARVQPMRTDERAYQKRAFENCCINSRPIPTMSRREVRAPLEPTSITRRGVSTISSRMASSPSISERDSRLKTGAKVRAITTDKKVTPPVQHEIRQCRLQEILASGTVADDTPVSHHMTSAPRLHTLERACGQLSVPHRLPTVPTLRAVAKAHRFQGCHPITTPRIFHTVRRYGTSVICRKHHGKILTEALPKPAQMPASSPKQHFATTSSTQVTTMTTYDIENIDYVHPPKVDNLCDKRMLSCQSILNKFDARALDNLHQAILNPANFDRSKHLSTIAYFIPTHTKSLRDPIARTTSRHDRYLSTQEAEYQMEPLQPQLVHPTAPYGTLKTNGRLVPTPTFKATVTAASLMTSSAVPTFAAEAGEELVDATTIHSAVQNFGPHDPVKRAESMQRYKPLIASARQYRAQGFNPQGYILNSRRYFARSVSAVMSCVHELPPAFARSARRVAAATRLPPVPHHALTKLVPYSPPRITSLRPSDDNSRIVPAKPRLCSLQPVTSLLHRKRQRSPAIVTAYPSGASLHARVIFACHAHCFAPIQPLSNVTRVISSVSCDEDQMWDLVQQVRLGDSL